MFSAKSSFSSGRWLAIALVLSNARTQVEAASCTWQPPGFAMEYDLSKFEAASSTAVQTALDPSGEGGQIYYDLCSNVKIPIECGDKVPAAPGFKTITEAADYLCFPLGELSTQKYSLLDANDPHKGFRVDYTSASPYKDLSVSVNCDAGGGIGQATASPCELRPATSTACNLMLNSVVGCPKPVTPWAIILCVCLFTGFGLYCAIGIVFNLRVKRTGFGVQAMPHLDFWRDLPSLVKEGIVFTILKLRGQIGKARKYEDV